MDFIRTIKRQTCGALYCGKPGGVMSVGHFTYTYGRTNQRLMFGSYTGNQCTSMALAAIIQHKIYSQFTPNTINLILKEGNKLHTRLREEIRLSDDSDKRIGIEDFPSNKILHVGKVFNRATYISLLEECKDVFTTTRKDFDIFPTLQSYLMDWHAKEGHGKTSFLITIGQYSYAILLRSNKTACMFDSHGNLRSDGVLFKEMAGAMEFPSIKELSTFLTEMFGLGRHAVIVPVKVSFQKVDVLEQKHAPCKDTIKAAYDDTNHISCKSNGKDARKEWAVKVEEGEDSPFVGMLGGGG